MTVDREQLKAYAEQLAEQLAKCPEGEEWWRLRDENPTPLPIETTTGEGREVVGYLALAPPLAVRFTAEGVGDLDNRSEKGGGHSPADWTAPLAKPTGAAEAEAFAEWFVSAIEPFIRSAYGPDKQPEASVEFDRLSRRAGGGDHIEYNSDADRWTVQLEDQDPWRFKTLQQLAEML